MPGKGKPFVCASDGPANPCGKDCPDRKAGCPTSCEKWKAYLDARNANYKKRRSEAENNAYSEAQKRSYRQMEQTKKRNYRRKGHKP